MSDPTFRSDIRVRAVPDGTCGGDRQGEPMRIDVLDHGYVRLVEDWGRGDAGEPEAGIIEAARTLTHRAIRMALGGKYRVDTAEGRIYGPEGELTIKRYPGQDCPTVRLHVAGLPKRAYSVPAHKVVAFALWGDAAFEPGVHVRHLDANTESNRSDNLRLGTPSQNEFDKPAEVRSRSARAARAAQGRTPKNALLTAEQAAYIRGELAEHIGPTGRVRRGVVRVLAERFGVSPSAISLIGKGRTWDGN